MSKMWINPFADNSNQTKICSSCGQDNDRYGLSFQQINEAIELVRKVFGTVNDITTVELELPQTDKL